MQIKGIFKPLLGIALAAILAGTGFAAEGRANHDPLQRMQTSLNLSPDQVSALQPAFTQMKQQRQSEHQAFKGKLQAVLTPDQFAQWQQAKGAGRNHHGLKELNLSADQKAQLKDYRMSMKPQIKAERDQFRSQLMAVLTPDQQAKLKSMHHGHHKHEGQQKMQQQ